MVKLSRKFYPHPRRRIAVAGVVLCALGIVFSPLGRSDNQSPSHLPEHCITGFKALVPSEQATPLSAKIPPQLNHWMETQGWHVAYALWQASRYCAAGYDPLGVCTQAPTLPAGACSSAEDGLSFLLMHRYLLQSLRSIWPEPYEALSPWRAFPMALDYPDALRSTWAPWPQAVRRAAASIDALARMDPAAVVARWPSEGAFGQWLQCGSSEGGQAVDALVPAMLSNATQAAFAPINPASAQDHYVFWRTHAWIDKAWDNYRKALGKTPDDPQLQAALLQQCQLQANWLSYSNAYANVGKQTHSTQADAPLFVAGQLNGGSANRWAKVLGQVVGQVDYQGRRFYQVDLRLVGVAPIWVTSVLPIAAPGLTLDGRYNFAGTPVNTGHFFPDTINVKPDKNVQDLINAHYILLVSSIQSIK